MPSSQIHKGVVISTFWHRSYAFLRNVASGREYFFHKTDVSGITPQKGDLVSFTVDHYNGREKAFNVRVADSPTAKAMRVLTGEDDGGAA